MRNQPIRCTFSFHLLSGLAKRKRLGLCEHVGQQYVMMAANSVQRLGKGDEVARNETCALMDQLIERVLAVGSRLTPVDRTGVLPYRLSIQCDVLAIAFHRQLLKIGGKALE